MRIIKHILESERYMMKHTYIKKLYISEQYAAERSEIFQNINHHPKDPCGIRRGGYIEYRRTKRAMSV